MSVAFVTPPAASYPLVMVGRVGMLAGCVVVGAPFAVFLATAPARPGSPGIEVQCLRANFAFFPNTTEDARRVRFRARRFPLVIRKALGPTTIYVWARRTPDGVRHRAYLLRRTGQLVSSHAARSIAVSAARVSGQDQHAYVLFDDTSLERHQAIDRCFRVS